MTPDGGSYQSQPGATGLTAEFTVTNHETRTRTFVLTCSSYGSVTCGTVSPASVTLAPEASAVPEVGYSTVGEGSGTLTLTASGTSSDNGFIFVTVANPAPVLALVRGDESVRDPSLCVATCFDYTWTHSTAPFYTLDEPRTFGLVYNSVTARPTPVILVDVASTGQNNTTYKVELRNAATSVLITQLNGATATYFAAQAGAVTRVAGAFDAVANGLGTGWYNIQVTVTANYSSGSSIATTVTQRVLVVNETGSVFGAGVMATGLQRLYFMAGSADVMAVEGGGATVYYHRTCPTCAYLTPGGTSATIERKTMADVNGVRYVRRYPGQVIATFRDDGRMLYLSDRFGNKIQYNWTDTLLTSITFPMNRSVALTYSTGGGITRLVAAIDPASRMTTYAIDANRRLTTVTDPDNVSQGLGYAGASQLVTTSTARGGFVSDITYDGTNRLASNQAPSIPLHDGTTGRPTLTWASDLTLVWQPAIPGTSAGSPKAGIRSDTLWARTADPLGRVTRYQLDRFGAPLKELAPGGLLSVTTRDTAGRPTVTISPRGRRIEYLYAGFDLVRRRDLYTQVTDSFAFNAAHDIAWSRVNGVVRQYNYWAPAGSSLALYYVWLPQRGVAENGYHHVDAMGRDTLIRNAVYWDTASAWNATRFAYEAAWGNKISWWDKHRGTSYRTIGVAGRPDTVRRFSGSQTVLTYDLLNRVRFSRNALGRLTEKQYDARGSVTRVIDPVGHVYRFGYNAAGWTVAVHDLADTLAADSLYYDLDGATRRIRRRDGTSVAFTFDARGRTITATAASAPARAWRYDSLDTWTVSDNGVAYDSTVTDAAGRDTLTYQRAGTVAFSIHRQFDSLSRLVRRTINAGVPSPFTSEITRYAFAGSGMVDTLCALGVCVDLNPEPWVSADGYPDVGRSDYGYIFNPGTPTNWYLNRQYDGMSVTDELARPAVSYPNSPEPFSSDIIQGAWGRTGNGTLFMRYPGRLGPPSWGDYFRADSLEQLLDACPGHPVNMPDLCDAPYLYAYDATGNRTDGVGGTIVAGGNRYQRFNGVQVTYDANGRVTGLNGTWGGGGAVAQTLTWDGFGQLIKVKNSATDSVLFGYDALGRRISRTTTAATTYFTYDGHRLIQDVGSSGQGAAAYSYYGPTDALFAIWTPQWSGVVLDDPVNGSVRQVVEKDGYRVIKTYSYGNWGETAADTGAVVRFRFAGTEYDQETGFYHMGSRYYLPQMGRFLSEDPAGIAEGGNLYVYSRNNPLSDRDAYGFGTECWADKFRPGEFFMTGQAAETEGIFLDFERQLYNQEAANSETEECRRKRENLKAVYEFAKALKSKSVAALRKLCDLPEVTLSGGVGGSLGGTPFIATIGLFAGGSLSGGITSHGRVVGQAQGYVGPGIGGYIGIGGQLGLAVTGNSASPAPTSPGLALNANIGAGESAGGSVQLDQNGAGANWGVGRYGGGLGLEISVTPTATKTWATPSLWGCTQ